MLIAIEIDHRLAAEILTRLEKMPERTIAEEELKKAIQVALDNISDEELECAGEER